MALKDMALNLLVTAKNKAGGALTSAKEQVTNFRKSLSDLKNEKGITAKLTKIKQAIGSFAPSASAAVGAIKSVGAGLVGLSATVAASVGAGVLFTRSQAQMAQEVTNTAKALNISRESVQGWRMAGKALGLEGDKMTDVLKDVSERIGELSAYGSGEAVEIFEKLNLDIEKFRQLRPDQQLQEVANAIGQLDSESEQVALLEQLASDASKLQPLLENNSKALKEIIERGKNTGAIIDDEGLDKLLEADRIYKEVDAKLKGIANQLSVALAPAISQTTEKLLDLFNETGAGEKLVTLFQSMAERFLEFSSYVLNNSDKISQSFTTLGNTFEFIYNTGVAAFRGLQTVVSGFVLGVATGFANVLTVSEKVAGVLNKLGVVSDQSYGSIQAKAEAARATTLDLEKQTIEYGKQAAEAAGKAASAFDDVKASSDKAKKAAEGGVGVLKPLVDEIGNAGDQAEEALRRQNAQVDIAKGKLKELGVDVERVFTGVTSAGREAIKDVGELATAIQGAGLESTKAAEAFKTGFQQALNDVETKEGLEEMKNKLIELQEAGTIGSAELANGLKAVREKQQEINQQKMNQTLEEAGISAEKTKEKVKELKDEAKDSGDDLEEAGEKGAGAFDWFGAVLTAAREGVTKLSNAARNAFEMSIGSNAFVSESESAEQALQRVEQELNRVGSSLRRLSAGDGFTKWALETEQASLQVQRQFYSQAAAMDRLVERVNNGSYSMAQLSGVANRAERDFDLLDQQQLQGLQRAIDSARQKMESLRDSADSTLNSLRQRLADIRGDTEEAQRLQYEAERQRLQEQLELAEQAGADEAVAKYEKSLGVLEEINRVEQKNRREEENRREKEAADRAREQQDYEQNRQQTSRLSDISQNRLEQPDSVVRRPTQTIVLQGPSGREVEVDTSSPDDLLGILEETGLRST